MDLQYKLHHSPGAFQIGADSRVANLWNVAAE